MDFSQLKNFIQNDPLSDWFSLMHYKYNRFKPNNKSTFDNEIYYKKLQYKQNFYNILKEINQSHYLNMNYNQTHDLIQSKTIGIFINCSLYHKKLDIIVTPNLIIHHTIFRKIFNEINIDLPEYIILDILYQIIYFTSDKQNILNQNNIFYHKCKLFIASQCIHPSYKIGYIFGKEYRYKNKIIPKKQNIGLFSFTSDMNHIIKQAIQWNINLLKNHNQWNILPKPSVKELYPNMNIKTGIWFNEKKYLAEKIKEITLVWNITYHKRCILFDKGITTWDDPILLHNIYPFQIKESKREFIQEKMIHINSQTELKIQPRRIKNSEFIYHIQNKENSIILDIESVIQFDEKESYFCDNIQDNYPKICIIGTILLNHDNIFKDFTIRYLNNKEEKIIIQYWLNFLNKYFKNNTIKIYHWGNAEKVYIKYMMNKYSDLIFPNFIFVDLLTYFKNEPIIIQGCFSYGLKDIVKQLYSHNLIQNQWNDDTNGLEAMIQIMKTSIKAEKLNIPLKRFTEIKNMIYYNYMDCKVISDILTMLNKMI